eukprot:TRINITY_DN9428_c1_g2_i1.p1 TRINITY_DN9428_c1_g2~~TRINITY_DN9428_c1_g2_i1.p1  ORF type:complete len:101 (+),score=10.93 TRINITY_DN9428_c1_g2_i1:321-623(+)
MTPLWTRERERGGGKCFGVSVGLVWSTRSRAKGGDGVAVNDEALKANVIIVKGRCLYEFCVWHGNGSKLVRPLVLCSVFGRLIIVYKTAASTQVASLQSF